jgi:hypothetical protein
MNKSFYLLPNVEILKKIVDLRTLTHYWTHIQKNIFIGSRQGIVIEKNISHRHFEDFAGKFCSYELIILFTSKCWDIGVNFRFTNVNSLLNSYSKKCSHQLQARNSHRKKYFSSSFWRFCRKILFLCTNYFIYFQMLRYWSKF